MKRILITGMSGVGKTAVVDALRRQGIAAIEMDEPAWSWTDAHGHQRWNVDRLRQAMADAGEQLLVVSGCAEDQVALYPQFDAIVLLSAPREILLQRLATRTGNPYGKHPAERATILRELDAIEPLLRRHATHEISTLDPLDTVVAELLAVSGAADDRPSAAPESASR